MLVHTLIALSLQQIESVFIVYVSMQNNRNFLLITDADVHNLNLVTVTERMA